MIERIQGFFVPTCDGCGEELGMADSFNEARDSVRDAGWRSIPPENKHGEWVNLCPECSALMDYND